MNPIKWLSAFEPGFKALQNEERHAILHFSLLWSLFEAKALDSHASSNSLLELVQRWELESRFDPKMFSDHLQTPP